MNVRLLTLPRGRLDISVGDAGRESDSNLSHPKNALDLIVSSSEGESKKIEDSAEQPKKHSLPSKRTVPGIQIDLSEEHSENVNSGISTSRDPVSNVKNESDLQSEKHSDPKISTDEGIQMDLSEMHEKNALSPIRFRCDTGPNVIAERN
jgi:hypothetical protein